MEEKIFTFKIKLADIDFNSNRVEAMLFWQDDLSVIAKIPETELVARLNALGYRLVAK